MTSLVLQATGGDGVSCRFTPHSIEDILRREEKETKMGSLPLGGRGRAESLGRLKDNIVLVGRGEDQLLGRGEDQHVLGRRDDQLLGRGEDQLLGKREDQLLGRGEDQHVLGRREDQLLGRGEKRGREEQAVSPSFEKVKTIRLVF